MTVNNKLDKTFGAVGAFAGVVILIFGVYACFYSWIGITTIIVGAFLAFTNTSTKIDFENKKARFSNNLFGIFSVGFWTEIKPDMKLAVQDSIKVQNSYSQSNREHSQKVKDYRIVLINNQGNTIMALKKFEQKEDAEKELIEFAKKLELE